jgi:pimeloyl-ACP methyl ester carboxylesterase
VHPLFLVHGGLGSASHLELLRAALDPALDITVVELEGHGQTPTEHPFSIARFSENVAAAVAKRGAEPAHLFGYSMGGYVALYLAATRPDLVASVVTLGTKLAWSPEVAERELRQIDPVKIRAKVPRFAEALERRHANAGGWELVLSRTAALMTSVGNSPIITDETLAGIAAPVRLMVGDRDAVVTVEETLSAARRLQRADLCVLPNTPHPLEQVRLPMVASLIADARGERSV